MSKYLTSLLIAAAFVVAGCGKNDASATASSGAAPAASSTPAAPAVKVLELTANDTMKYNTTTLEAKSGEFVRVVLENVGNTPKAAMGHNFVLLKAGVDANAFVAACATAGPANEYFAKDHTGDVIAHIKLLGPKEKGEVSFAAPAPGEYTYICTFPGHMQSGMKGVLTVK